VDTGYFDLYAEKTKEAGCNWMGGRKQYADLIMPALVNSTDIREGEMVAAFSQYQLQARALEAQQRRMLTNNGRERIAIQ
jgi:hypothetical protein